MYIDRRSSLTILRMDDPYLPALDQIQENYLYTGLDNPLLYNDTYDLTFHCDFDLTNYPFDSQHCFIKVKMLLKIHTIFLSFITLKKTDKVKTRDEAIQI